MPTWWILLAWLIFAGTHLALGLPPWRDRLAARLGEQRFVALFSAIAAISLGLLALAVALHGGSGSANRHSGKLRRCVSCWADWPPWGCVWQSSD